MALIAGKVLATVFLFGHLPAGLDAAYGQALRVGWFWVGKTTPTLFCLAFVLDAAIYRKDHRAIVFWSWITAIVLALTIAVLMARMHAPPPV